MKSPAAIADGQGSFAIEEIEVASPQADEVLVEIHAAGICHTDHASLSWGRPLVMGHEGAGVVVEVGASVENTRAGDRVVLNWAISCGKCFQCEHGHAVLCEVSKPAHVMQRSAGHAHAEGTLWKGVPIDRSFNLGTLARLVLVRREAISHMPAWIPYTSACIVGCGVMTGFGSVKNVAQVQPGQSVVVIGCGGVGLNVIQTARIAKAAKIIAVDIHPSSLDRARLFGATDVIVADREDRDLRKVAEKVREMTAGRGSDHAFEATGIPALAFVPLLMIRDGGLALQVSGINDSVTATMPWFMWNKRYVTPLYGDCQPQRDFPRIFDHYQRGELKLDELVSKTYRLEQLGEAFDDMLSGRNAKGVILFDL